MKHFISEHFYCIQPPTMVNKKIYGKMVNKIPESSYRVVGRKYSKSVSVCVYVVFKPPISRQFQKWSF